MASLLKIKNHYYSQFYDTARTPARKRIPLKTKTLKVAERLHRALEDDHASGEFDPWTGFRRLHQGIGLTANSTIKSALEVYIETKSREDWRSTTKETTSYVLNAFGRDIGVDKSVQTITPERINRYLNQDQFAYETKKTHKTKIKPFAGWLVRKKILKYDFSEVKIYNNDKEQDETVSYLSADEAEILKNGIRKKVTEDISKGYQNKDRNALWLIDFIDWQRYSGMRLSETLSLTPRSINTDTWYVTIGSKSFSTKVKSKQVLPIGEVEILKKIAKKKIEECSHPDDLLFGHKDRRRTYRTFKKYRKEYLPNRADIHIHSLRHTCCIELLRKGVPIYTVQRWMRHSSIRTTQKYADLLAVDISEQVGQAFSTKEF